ncbi:MAG: putative sensor domain DACNV-containing protein, partial [Polyangiales bacterium]
LAVHLRGAGAASPLPTDDELLTLVEATFFASLHEEEARRAEFAVAWEPAARDCSAVLAILPPIAVTPRNLAKLAPAALGEATSIAVRAEGDQLVAWALLDRSTAVRQPLTLRALGAGVVRVDFDGSPCALYVRGEMLFLGEHRPVKSPSRWLTRTFAAWAASADAVTGIDVRAAIVTRVAARARAHGHGGMILVIPATTETPSGVRVHYGVADGANVLADRFAQVISDVPVEDRLARLTGSRLRGLDGRISVRDEAQIAYAEAIELVARLTAVDNALLLDTDLRIRGFGVQVSEGDAPQRAFEHTSPYTDDVHTDDLSTFKGTRHPAGVIFCMRQDSEAAALIASQDGNLSLATKDARGAIGVLGSYRHAFGWR